MKKHATSDMACLCFQSYIHTVQEISLLPTHKKRHQRW